MNFPNLNEQLAWRVVFHPLFVALVTTILIAVIFPFHYSKYKMDLIGKEKFTQRKKTLYADLDNNGFSERIIVIAKPVGGSALSVFFEPSKKTAQWDYYGKCDFYNDNFLIADDFNHDGIRDLFLYSVSNDSLFLHCITDVIHEGSPVKTRFITRIGVKNGNTQSAILPASMDDLNGDGEKELIFGINSGYTYYPRRVYAYDIVHDSLLRSPECGFYIHSIIQSDVNGRNPRGILISGYASNNAPDSCSVIHDRNCRLIALDHRLRFLFPPVEFNGIYGGVMPLALNDQQSSRHSLFVIHSASDERKTASFLEKFDSAGKPVKKLDIAFLAPNIGNIPLIIKEADGPRMAIYSEKGYFFLFDEELRNTGKIDFPYPFGLIYKMDVDRDGEEEIINYALQDNHLSILRNDLTHASDLILDLPDPQKMTLSVIESGEGLPLLCISTDTFLYKISYQPDMMYYERWGLYALIYLFIYIFIQFIRKIQRVQIEKRVSAEKKITELQMKIVRNQMDPHFTMNAINSVIDAVNRQEKEEAKENLLHFSKMYRSLVLSADKIRRTLKEEIEFTENYLSLEKFRLKDKFEYSIAFDPAVDPDWEVPKMIIQSPVENAVKHGIEKKKDGGRIEITASTHEKYLILCIFDNGIGRKNAGQAGSGSTGKGLIIMDQFLELYKKISGMSVTSEIEDLLDESGSPSGTRVIIRIPVE